MSAALLHAILVNHVAHKHASDMAKQVENNLRDKLSEVQAEKEETKKKVAALLNELLVPKDEE